MNTQTVDDADTASEIPQTSRYKEIKDKIDKSITTLGGITNPSDIKKSQINAALQTLVDAKVIFSNLVAKDDNYEKLILENSQLKEEVIKLTNQIILDESDDMIIEGFTESCNLTNDGYLKSSKLKASNSFSQDDNFATVSNKKDIIHDESVSSDSKCFDSIDMRYLIDGNYSKDKKIPIGMANDDSQYSDYNSKH